MIIDNIDCFVMRTGLHSVFSGIKKKSTTLPESKTKDSVKKHSSVDDSIENDKVEDYLINDDNIETFSAVSQSDIVNVLLNNRIIVKSQLNAAKIQANNTGMSVLQCLISMDFVTEKQVNEYLYGNDVEADTESSILDIYRFIKIKTIR